MFPSTFQVISRKFGLLSGQCSTYNPKLNWRKSACYPKVECCATVMKCANSKMAGEKSACPLMCTVNVSSETKQLKGSDNRQSKTIFVKMMQKIRLT